MPVVDAENFVNFFLTATAKSVPAFQTSTRTTLFLVAGHSLKTPLIKIALSHFGSQAEHFPVGGSNHGKGRFILSLANMVVTRYQFITLTGTLGSYPSHRNPDSLIASPISGPFLFLPMTGSTSKTFWRNWTNQANGALIAKRVLFTSGRPMILKIPLESWHLPLARWCS